MWLADCADLWSVCRDGYEMENIMPIDPDKMTEEEQFREVARILAIGLLRLHKDNKLKRAAQMAKAKRDAKRNPTSSADRSDSATH